MSSNPHASPSRLSTNSFYTHTHRHKDGPMHTCLSYWGTRTPLIYALQSHTDIQRFTELISPFNWLQEGDDSHTLQIQLVKSRVKKWGVVYNKRRLSCGQGGGSLVCPYTLTQTYATRKTIKTVTDTDKLQHACICTVNKTPPPALTRDHCITPPGFFCPQPFPCSHCGAEMQPPFKSHNGRRYKWSCFAALSGA